ncbi:MAG: GLUG motif-containing protein [Planctomycetota bacterium]|jgi:hypothetical protein
MSWLREDSIIGGSSGGLAGRYKLKAAIFLVVVVCVFCSAAFGQPWVGSGTAEDPYQIWTGSDMQAIGGNSAYWGAHFKLMADIDLSAYTGTSFNIIGTYWQNPFTGVFDGNGHTISNFTYTSTGTGHIGLFRYFGFSGEIKNLGLIDPNVDAGTGGKVGSLVASQEWGTITGCYVEDGSVSGNNHVGGLVGYEQRGLITNSYSTASVSGAGYNTGGLVGNAFYGTVTGCYSAGSVSGVSAVGGLVGISRPDSTVTNCYSEGSVSGDANVGGLVGRNETPIIHCYSTASVSGTTNIGGLVGSGGPVCASFWDTQTSGQSTSGGGTPKSTAEMQTASTFFGWGGCGSEGVWFLDEGNDYPRLWWENKPGQPLPTENLSDFVAGAGTEQDPYLIETGEQMNMVGVFWCEWGKHFKLTADIDLSAYTGTSFNIIGIGHYDYTFRGTFDGNGHTISNFSYDSNNTDCIGLFGRGGGIKDLGLINPNVDAGTGNGVGSLVGVGGVTGCYVEGGSVSGGSSVGGLVGGGDATNCTSSASVSGIEDVGGLVGGGSATNCTSSASVSGTTSVGGLVGGGSASNCTSSASVSGTTSVGGLMGKSGTITSCYSDGIVSGVSEVGGLVGRNEITEWGAVAAVTNSYSTSSVSGVTDVGGLVGRNEIKAGFEGVAALTNCYSSGSVTGYWYVGGLLGSLWRGEILDCYSAGSVSGVTDVGGLLGYKEAGSTTDSFWDTETSEQETSAGGVGLPTELMQTGFIFTAAGWDFVGETVNGTDDFWDICDGTNYPKLAWQVPVLGDFGCPDGVDWSDVAVLCEQWLLEELSWDVWPEEGDGMVDFRDWAVFASEWKITNDIAQLSDFADQWLQIGSNYYIADITPSPGGDGIVNFGDFAAQAASWLVGR